MGIDVALLHELIAPRPMLLFLAVAIDLAVGDPSYAWHPVRLIGRLLTSLESAIRSAGLDGYAGGIVLFILLSTASLVTAWAALVAATALHLVAAFVVHLFTLYSLLALGDLLRHVWRIEAALHQGDLAGARTAASLLVGRDTDRMDAAACRRAGVESLSENLADGFVSPIFWYGLGGLAGLVVFKVVSTMDSMVGYKTDRYLRFGWCGARLDDVMNYLPARLTWMAIGLVASALPRVSGIKAWRIGFEQHGILLGPNAGWSEAATAGALERRLVGPIWLKGTLVTEQWIGAPDDPPLATRDDLRRGVVLVGITGVTVAATTGLILLVLTG